MRSFFALTPSQAAFSWFMSGQFLWFLAVGIQVITFQAVAALVLQLSATEIGIAQAAILFPAIAFVLLGGIASEHNDHRLLLIRIQIAAALPPCALAILVITKNIDFSGLIIYGLLMGTISAFAIPARNMILPYIVQPDRLQKSISIATGLQFTANIGGMLIIILSQNSNIGWFIMLQAILMALAAFSTHQLPYHITPIVEQKQTFSIKKQTKIIQDIRYALDDKTIAPILIMLITMSVFYIGTFFVFFPLIIRDIYHGDMSDLAAVNGLFWTGMMIASFLLVKIGHVLYLGKLLVLAASSGLVILLLFSIPAPFWWLLTLCFLAGCGGGTFLAAGRAIIQTHPHKDHHEKLISIYLLAFMSGAPIGALGFGWLADSIPSLYIAPLVPMIAMLISITLISFFSNILSVKLDQHEQTH